MRTCQIAFGFALLATPASAQIPAEARAFETGLYAAYERGEPDYLGRGAGAVFSPRLLSLIRSDQAATPEGDAPALDWDPICDCQDSDELEGLAVVTARAGSGRVRATARFRQGGETRTVRLDLVSAGGRWRVDEIRTSDVPSLVGLLLKAR